MEKEINIAAILKDKPKGLKLWSDTFGELIVDCINEQNDAYPIFLTLRYGNNICLTKDGCYYRDEAGTLPCIVPSKSMRDWSKFAWKKGDVVRKKTDSCVGIFDSFMNDDYATFRALYYYDAEDKDYLPKMTDLNTLDFEKVDEINAMDYIKNIEGLFGGKLNLETLEIEKPQFKDGDIVTEYSNSPFVTIFIFKKFGEYWEKTLSFYSYLQEGSFRTTTGWIDIRKNFKFRLATDEEKQRLFDALANKNKAWDADKKAIVDLHKKCEFKPKDWCLMRFRGTNKDVWKLCQFGFIDCKDKNDFGYCAIGGNWFDECIPYNDQTAHLLGTTDDWKGGEE